MEKRFERKIVKLSEIQEDPTNPNLMDDRKKEALNQSIEKFGYVMDIVVDKKTGMIADGFHRLQDLKERNIKEAEVIVFDFKDDSERRLFRQIANKLHGEHDPKLDASEYRIIMEDYTLEDFSALLGESEQEIIKLLDNEQELIENDDVQKVDKLYHHQVTCPKCGNVFEKQGGI